MSSSPVHTRLPQSDPLAPLPALWWVLRGVALAAFVALTAAALADVALARVVFWQLAVPSLPLVFLVAPGVWRNVCPLGFLNQLPRMLGLSRGWNLPRAARERVCLAATLALVVAVLLRRPLLDHSGPALGALLALAAALALAGGMLFKGKSGWCGTFCPLAPVQAAYGHAPIADVANRYCTPCVGCQKHCYDIDPRRKLASDLDDASEEWRDHRKLVVGVLPGLVWAYFRGPDPADVGLLAHFATALQAVLVSLALLYVALHAFSLPVLATVRLYALGALLLFYLFALPVMGDGLVKLSAASPAVPSGVPRPSFPAAGLWAGLLASIERVYGLSAVVLAHAAAWLCVAALAVWSFIAGGEGTSARRRVPVVTGVPAPGQSTRVRERSSDREIVVGAEQSLLEALEAARLPIEAGCRLGVCGADPILVVEGEDNLEPATDDETETLRRIGLAGRARLACMCRPTGPLTIDLDITQAAEPSSTAPASPAAEPADDGPRYVVVGNGVAGITFAEQLRRALPKARITVVGREPHHFYNRMGIERLIYGRSVMSGLHLADDAWFEKRRIDFWLNTVAAEIDRRRHELVLGTGERIGYHKLVLATGANAVLPGIRGRDLPGCFVVREADDAIRLRAFVQSRHSRSALVLGGGILGVEVAEALRRANMAVTVVHSGPWLMERQLDEPAAALLTAHLKQGGVDTITGTTVSRLTGERDVLRAAELEDGRRIGCQLLVACAGALPNLALAQRAGLETAHGVIVDERMTTSDPDVLCIGDAAESPHGSAGLWPTAVLHAKIAVAALTGQSISETDIAPPVRLKLSGIDVRSIGRTNARPGDLVIAGGDADGRVWRRLVLRDRQIVGCVFVDDPANAQAAFELMAQRISLIEIEPALRRGDWASLRQLQRRVSYAADDTLARRHRSSITGTLRRS